MDFETISKKAYLGEYINGTTLEQLVWYKMRDIYKDYEKGILTLQESQVKKVKVEAFYKKQYELDNFYKKIHDERYSNVRESEEILKNILEAEKQKVNEKDITKMLIDYVVKITGIVPIKTEYEKNYEVK